MRHYLHVLLLKLGDQMACTYIIQRVSNGVAMKDNAVWFVQTRRMIQQTIHKFKDEEKGNIVIYVQVRQMKTGTNNKIVQATPER
jgi:hypothetical protein